MKRLERILPRHGDMASCFLKAVAGAMLVLFGLAQLAFDACPNSIKAQKLSRLPNPLQNPFPCRKATSQNKGDPQAKDKASSQKERSARSECEKPALSQDLVPRDQASFEEMVRRDWDKLQDRFNREGIHVDLKHKRVEVKGAIIRDKESPQYPLEYVVVSTGGYTHEALVLVKATPSILNAALVSIGLKPGKTITFKRKDPPPPKEDIESGRVKPYDVIPPQGQRVYIYVKYDGWKERPIRFLEDMMVNLRTGRPLERIGWIYIGSRFAKVIQGTKKVYRYMADMERNIVACYLTGYGNALFDINSTEAINDELFDVNPFDAPPMGAPITLIISLDPL